MPLLRRRPVPLLPVPEFDEQAEGKDPQVYYLKATGEIFKDYEAYAARLTFFLTRQFQCEYSGKTNLDYFSALASEKQESRIVRERFPDVLKGRVLATVQFRVMGRLDSLVDLVFERYKDRYFPNEQCFIDIQGDKYLAKIVRVFPPQSVRDAAFAEQQAAIAAAATTENAASPAASTSANPDGARPPRRPVVAPLDYDAIAHRLGCDLNVDAKKARTEDNPEEYLYTLQLMDEQYRFEGSSMEVHARQLSRDRLTFSKSIMKRYLRECLVRDAAIGSPWTVKPSIARMFGIPERQSDTVEERNREAKEAKLAKRRKPNPDGSEASSTQGPTKRRKTADGAKAPRTSTPAGEADTPKERKAPEPRAKAIKYPIEDLELDPMSIHDGRVLRRVNADLPPLPPKPQPKRTLPVPREQFDRFVETWNALNIFAKPLNLSTFSMDDYAGALEHDTLSPRCILLVEIHASLTNVLGTDGSRVLGSTTAVPSRRPAGGAAAPVASTHEDENEDQLDPDHPVSESTPAPGTESVQGGGGGDDQLDGDEIPYEESELNKLVRLGIAYAKRWDRQAKLKYSESREGWERHLVGALCQRGGPIHMPNFVRIMRHLFAGHPDLPEQDVAVSDEMETGGENGANGDGDGDGDVKPDQTTASEAVAVANGTAASEANSTLERRGAAAATQSGSRQPSREPQEGGDPTDRVEQHYLSLSLEDKLDIIDYLVTLVMGTKVVRTYIEESELRLTELRKQRADVNKERKALLEQKAIQDNGGVPPKANGASKAAGTPAAQQNGDASTSTSSPATPAASNGTQAKASVLAEAPQPTRSATPAAAAAEDEEEDQLASDDDASSVAPSEAGSTTNLSRRQAVLEEKRLEKLRGGRSSSVASSSGGRRQSGTSATLSLEEQLRLNSERDDETEREFRRYLGVTRCRPLGRDRFHCRYWWFDGIGGMNLAGTGKGEVTYGTGRLFVQGPSVEDWELICDSRKEEGDGSKSMLERRMREEVVDDPSALLGPDEWAYYEDEDELEDLNNWLNAKGTRELALKNALTKWRPFIIAGAKKRQFDAAHPDLPRYDFGGRRSSRKDPVAEIANTYLGWRNSSAKF
ncbi:hypothetical protein C6P46_004220 [Rhodotorula mucilaginosa]|uniref:WAC domain-containing protein n=1 Tax=Rhodotorula mucilaginosa TaxID=5537 RepID=A0A9P7B5I2_RHOMI|nr:hypothetical protein C6P46_004220 [Rhodotorula mucilaginosa]